jgi:hypothetical protein
LPGEALDVLDRVLDALGGDAAALAAKTRGSSRVDFIVEPRGVVVEYDEVQHFTTARLETLALYPVSVQLGFDLDEYVALVRRWASRATGPSPIRRRLSSLDARAANDSALTSTRFVISRHRISTTAR